MKKEMENETKNVNTEISDDELEQAAGGQSDLSKYYRTCPKCSSQGIAVAQALSRNCYKCLNCGHGWVE